VALAFSETIAVVRQVLDRFGDEASNTTHTIDGCAVWPVTTTENIINVDIVNWTMVALVPTGSDVLATDRIAYQGTIYDVVGQPTNWRSYLTGHKPGIELHLVASTG